MTNAELIAALRYCAEHEGCDYYIAKDCPRESTWMCGVDCDQILMLDAAAALKAADKRIAELEAQLPKEGEWIIKPHGTYWQLRAFCSACGKHSGIGGIVSNQKKPYCPNCGAKMKGEQE